MAYPSETKNIVFLHFAEKYEYRQTGRLNSHCSACQYISNVNFQVNLPDSDMNTYLKRLFCILLMVC